MSQATAPSVLRNRAAVVAELRRLLPRMEGLHLPHSIPFGLAAIDDCLPQGGLASSGLHEIVPAEGASPAAFGFLVALLAHISSPLSLERREPTLRRPLILVLPGRGLRDYGRPHGHGLHALGLDPGRLIVVETAQRKDALWAMEEALRADAAAAVAGILDKLDLKTSQRLQLTAGDCALPLLLLRTAEFLQSSAAATRWKVAAAPATRDRFGLIAGARWRLALERCRNGRTGEWMVEYDHVAHRFSLAAALADPAFPRRAAEKSWRRAG